MSRKELVSRRTFIAGTAALAGSSVLPSAVTNLAAQDPVTDTVTIDGKRTNRDRVQWQAIPFPLTQVKLLPGPFLSAQQANQKYLHSLATDRLAHSFRVTSGFSSAAQPYGGWEKPDSELRGHFCGGHYLSAIALSHAAYGDDELKKNGDALVAILAQCQTANKNGYLSAFPEEFFQRLHDRVRVWAPFYTYHKIMAGLLDMYTFAGNEQALDSAKKMAEWVDVYSATIPYERMQRMLQTEYGGMGEVLLNLYAVTGNGGYIGVARRFDKREFYQPLLEHRDELKGLHVNTHIPQVIAAARAYEITRNSYYRDIADYFWDEVVGLRSYCNGGTSNGEGWATDPGKLSTAIGPSSTEDCCAYNMLKLTRHLFGWNPEARYMDYYERVLFNHRLGTIDPETGTTMYYYPLGTNMYKTYATPADSFWCCNGTGVEEFSKLADTIYFHDADSVYVNLYIPSELNWAEKGLKLRQETKFPAEESTKITVTAEKPADLTIRLRIPYWVGSGGAVKVNGRVLPVFGSPSSYLALRGPWKTGDTIELALPMHIHNWRMPDDDTIQAAMYGPVVIVPKREEVSNELTYGQLGPYKERGVAPGQLPAATGKIDDTASWIEPSPNAPLTFRTIGQGQQATLVPINQIVHERYDVFWKVNQPPPPPRSAT